MIFVVYCIHMLYMPMGGQQNDKCLRHPSQTPFQSIHSYLSPYIDKGRWLLDVVVYHDVTKTPPKSGPCIQLVVKLYITDSHSKFSPQVGKLKENANYRYANTILYNQKYQPGYLISVSQPL